MFFTSFANSSHYVSNDSQASPSYGLLFSLVSSPTIGFLFNLWHCGSSHVNFKGKSSAAQVSMENISTLFVESSFCQYFHLEWLQTGAEPGPGLDGLKPGSSPVKQGSRQLVFCPNQPQHRISAPFGPNKAMATACRPAAQQGNRARCASRLASDPSVQASKRRIASSGGRRAALQQERARQ